MCETLVQNQIRASRRGPVPETGCPAVRCVQRLGRDGARIKNAGMASVNSRRQRLDAEKLGDRQRLGPLAGGTDKRAFVHNNRGVEAGGVVGVRRKGRGV